MPRDLHAFFSSPLWLRIASVWLISAPLVGWMGNALADIWLSSIAIAFLVVSIREHRWGWAKEPWMQAALLFVVWWCISSLLKGSFNHTTAEALLWIRFPVFALGFAYFYHRTPHAPRLLLRHLFLGVIALIVYLAWERLTHSDAHRLYGPHTLSLKGGWYLVGFGMPLALLCFERVRRTGKGWILALSVSFLVLFSTLSTGEVYSTVSALFCLGLYVLFARLLRWPILVTGILAVALIVPLLMQHPALMERFTTQALQRLPWRPTSDYYVGWQSAFSLGKQHPWTGIGPNNYYHYCLTVPKDQILTTYGLEGSVAEEWVAAGTFNCYHHPHQMYLQFFAEGGIPALLLFCAMVGLLLHRSGLRYKRPFPFPEYAFSMALMIMTFWPLATHSNGFGQFKNFFYWFMVAMAFAYLPPAQKKPEA